MEPNCTRELHSMREMGAVKYWRMRGGGAHSQRSRSENSCRTSSTSEFCADRSFSHPVGEVNGRSPHPRGNQGIPHWPPAAWRGTRRAHQSLRDASPSNLEIPLRHRGCSRLLLFRIGRASMHSGSCPAAASARANCRQHSNWERTGTTTPSRASR